MIVGRLRVTMSPKPKISEYKAWFQVIADKRANNKTKRFLLNEIPADGILGVQELLSNLKHNVLPVDSTFKKEIKRHRATLNKLASPGFTVKQKRNLLRGKRGIAVLEKVVVKLFPILKSHFSASPPQGPAPQEADELEFIDPNNNNGWT